MHFPSTTALTLLLTLSTGTSALALTPIKRLPTIPLSFYSGSGCNTDIAVTTAYIPTDGTCFPTSPIFSGDTDSALISTVLLANLPPGCSGTFSHFLLLHFCGLGVVERGREGNIRERG